MRSKLSTLAELVGAALVVTGVALLSPVAAVILAGGMLIAVGYGLS